MDLFQLNLKRFHFFYLSFFFVSILGFVPIVYTVLGEQFLLVFYLGFLISFFIQFGFTELRFLPIYKPTSEVSGFSIFTVVLSFFVNLSTVSAILILEYPFETIIGFFIAYFLHLLFLVIASYFSGK
jgi:hypothetical protein